MKIFVIAGVVGIILKSDWFSALTTHDTSSALQAAEFSTGWFAEPLLGNGDYPAAMKSAVGGRLPTFTDTTQNTGENV